MATKMPKQEVIEYYYKYNIYISGYQKFFHSQGAYESLITTIAIMIYFIHTYSTLYCRYSW